MPESTPPNRPRPKPALIGVGVLVVALGFALPQLTPAPQNPPAQEPGSATPAPEPAAPAVKPSDAGIGPALARLAGGLVVVCVLCVLATRYLARGAQTAAGPMKVLASLRVGPRCVVHLVSADGRRLLIGTDAAGVKALVELPPGEPESSSEPAAPPEVVADSATASVVVGPMPLSADPPGADDILALLARAKARGTGEPASG